MMANKNKKPFCLLRNGFFNSLNRVNQNVNLIMKDLSAFKGSGFQRYWFWLSFGFGFCFVVRFFGIGWFRFFQVRIQGFSIGSGFQEFGFSGFGFNFPDLDGFGFFRFRV